MKNSKILIFYISLLLMLFCTSDVLGQDWRKIIPMQTTCEEVKVILKVNYCSAPDSQYKFPKLTVYVVVSAGQNKEKVPAGTVTRMLVSLRNLTPLKDFEENLEGFEILPDGDLPNSRIYKNDRRGISITVQKIWDHSDVEYVTGVDLYPPNLSKTRICWFR